MKINSRHMIQAPKNVCLMLEFSSAELLFVAGYQTIIQHQNTQLVHQGYSRGQFPLKTKSIQWLIMRAEFRRLERKLFLFNTNEYHQKKN